MKPQINAGWIMVWDDAHLTDKTLSGVLTVGPIFNDVDMLMLQ